MAIFSDAAVDPLILARARRGDIKAHEILYRTYGGAVYSLARHLVRQDAIADEILQETFVEVISKIDGFKGNGSFAGWLRRIAVNKCLMHLRSSWHRRSQPLEFPGESGQEPVENHGSGNPAPETVQEQMDLEAALANLPAKARAVVWLHDVEGYTHGEIGQMMSKTASFSKSQLARAHEKLRDLLATANENESCMQISNSY